MGETNRVRIEIDLDWYGDNEKPIGWYGYTVYWNGQETKGKKKRQLLNEFLKHCKTLSTK